MAKTNPPEKDVVHEVTRLLEEAGQGRSHAAEALLPLVYEQLRKLAAHRMTGEHYPIAGMLDGIGDELALLRPASDRDDGATPAHCRSDRLHTGRELKQSAHEVNARCRLRRRTALYSAVQQA